MIVRHDIESSPFKILQDQAIARIQELCGKQWTDFNEHDPGITILDALHYALLELQYTLEFPFESYLGTENKYEQFGLFSPEELFTPAIVTPQDYENLIVSKIKEVIACKVRLLGNHRYLIEVKIQEKSDHENVSQKINELYHANRNLCETLQSVSIKTSIENRQQPVDDTPEYQPSLNEITADVLFSEAYESFQNHFPDCYGINEKGVPSGITNEHKAKIKQLQAYLLIFDFLIANTKQQVGNIPQLFELSGKIPNNNLPELSLKEIDLLLDKNHYNKNQSTDQPFLHLQKSHYLDTLDTLYGEDTRRYFSEENELASINQKRADLIQKLPHLNAIRFRSFNILKKNETGNNIPGITQFLSATDNYQTVHEGSIINLFSRYNIKLVNDETFFSEYKNLNIEFITEYIEYLPDYELEAVPKTTTIYDNEKFHRLKRSINLFRHNTLFESFLSEGSNPDHYKITGWHDPYGYLLIFKIPQRKEWLSLGLFRNKQRLIETANLLWDFLKMLQKQSQQIYLVEHLLLNINSNDYNRLSIVIPDWTLPFSKKKTYESLLCERLPAHLDIRFLWLEAEKMYDFERIYYEWRQAMSEKDEKRTRFLSRQIQLFLI